MKWRDAIGLAGRERAWKQLENAPADPLGQPDAAKNIVRQQIRHEGEKHRNE